MLLTPLTILASQIYLISLCSQCLSFGMKISLEINLMYGLIEYKSQVIMFELECAVWLDNIDAVSYFLKE